MVLSRHNSFKKNAARKNSSSTPSLPPPSSRPQLPPSFPVCTPNHMYVPQTHRQQTTVASLSPVGSALKRLAATDLTSCLNSEPGLIARQELSAIMESIHLGLSRGLVGLKYRKFILAQTFTHWQVRPEHRIICFLPVEIKGAVLCHRDSGSGFVQFSDFKDGEDSLFKSNLVNDKFQSACYVSSQKIYKVLKKFLLRSLSSKEISTERLNFSSRERKLEIALQDVKGWIAEIVPCLVIQETSTMFCCRPFYDSVLGDKPNSEVAGFFSIDSSTPRTKAIAKIRPNSNILSEYDSNKSSSVFSPTPEHSELIPPVKDLSTFSEEMWPSDTLHDVVWYSCAPRSENRLVKNISRTDKGVRFSAMGVVYKICQADWRLRDVSAYDVQTAMLHDADHQLDHTPRWQRETLEYCVRAILAKLGLFAHTRNLPHFLVQDVNLWAHIPTKRLALMSGAIDRLTSNDVALVSLVCRAGQFSLPTNIHIYADFLTPSPCQVNKRHYGNGINRSVDRSLKKMNKKYLSCDVVFSSEQITRK